MTDLMTAPRPHDVIWVVGDDAVEFLDGLLSQSVEAMDAGSVARSLLLSPQGKLRAPIWILRGDDRVGIAVESGYADRVTGDLGRFRLRVDVSFGAEDRPVAEVVGNAARDLVKKDTWFDEGGELVADLAFMNSGLPRILTTKRAASAVSEETFDAMRIAVGEPRLDVDVDETTIPQEADMVQGAVDFSKGCYLGQELVARIDSRGRVNRHLRGLLLNSVAHAGAAVIWEDREMGTITSVADHPDLGPIALGMVRREVDPGTSVIVKWDEGQTSAEVRVLPLLG